MKKLTIVITALLALFVSRETKAAISDCATQECIVSMTDSSVIFYDLSGTVMGSTTAGTGSGRIAAKDGYVFVSRSNATQATIIDVANNGTQCNVTMGGAGYATVVAGYAFILNHSLDEVFKVNFDCSSPVSIPVGGYPSGIATDGTKVYVVNSLDGNLTEIDPVTEAATTVDIGITDPSVDQLEVVTYHSGTDSLYISTAWGVMKVALPGYTRTDWWNIGQKMLDIDSNSGYILTEQASSGDAYLIPVSNPGGYMTLTTNAPRSVTINETTAFVAGQVVDDGIKEFDMSGVHQGYLTTTLTYSIAHVAPTQSPPQCGDSTREGTELCDGTDLGGETCVSQGFDGGSLACNGTCDGFDTSQCYECGDGTVNTGEECDNTNLNGETCSSQGFAGGTLACTASCTFDTSQCTTCGNGNIDAGEECDGSNLNGETCSSQGFDGGTLNCSSCSFDTSSCTLETCGNGVIDTGEECDDSNTTAGDGCGSDCQIEQGFECTGEPSVCTALPECGDGTADPNEACDGDDLKGATCESLGFDSGTLTCTAGCAFDTSQCEGTPLPPVENITGDPCSVSNNEWGAEPVLTAPAGVTCSFDFYVSGRENDPINYEIEGMDLTLKEAHAEAPAEGDVKAVDNGNSFGFYSNGVSMGVEGTVWQRLAVEIETDSGAVHRGGLYRCDEGSISVTAGSETRTLIAGEEVLVDYDLGRFVDDDKQPPPGGNCNNGCSQTGGALPSGGMILVFLIVLAFLLLSNRAREACVKVRNRRRR